MWVSRLSTVWITWEDKVHVVESEAVDQTKWVTKIIQLVLLHRNKIPFLIYIEHTFSIHD